MRSPFRMRILSALLAGGLCFGQAPVATDDMARIQTRVTVVIAPTTVLTKSGDYVNGLELGDFTLYDNGKPQRITADVAFEPLSIVIAVQKSSSLDEILPKIQKIGSLLDALVVGQSGEAAVVAFDHRVQVVQDFTSDGGKIDVAMKSIKPGSSSAVMIDAVTESVRMLAKRGDGRRRVLLLISEKRDKASEGRLREALTAAQFANVSIYSIDISHMAAQFTHKPEAPRPDPFPAPAQHLPPGSVQTPTTVDIQQNSGNYIPMFVEIFKGVKSIFVDDTLDTFVRYTGGKEYAFLSQKSLEKAVTAIGQELHSQYLLSYSPSNPEEGGFHEIRVSVNRPHFEVRTRPGYWVAARP